MHDGLYTIAAPSQQLTIWPTMQVYCVHDPGAVWICLAHSHRNQSSVRSTKAYTQSEIVQGVHFNQE